MDGESDGNCKSGSSEQGLGEWSDEFQRHYKARKKADGKFSSLSSAERKLIPVSLKDPLSISIGRPLLRLIPTMLVTSPRMSSRTYTMDLTSRRRVTNHFQRSTLPAEKIEILLQSVRTHNGKARQRQT
jgi:hypothetical protein